MKTIHHSLILLFGIFIPLCAQHQSLYPDIAILSSDDNGMTIEFRPKFLESRTITSGRNTYEVPLFQFASAASDADAGMEDIRVRICNLGFPGYSGNTVTVVAADYETMKNFSLAPVPEVRMVDQLGAIEQTYAPKFRSDRQMYPAAIATLDNFGMTKGWLTGNLILAPYQYRSSAKTLLKYTRIVVRIGYGARQTVFDDRGSDIWAQVSLLNYPVAKRWSAVRTLKKSSAASSVLAGGTWYKLEVADDGMYRIDANYLLSLGVDLSSLSMTDVKIFGSDGKAVPETVPNGPISDLPQIDVRYVDNNANTKFDADDYVLFYGQGVTGWNYSAADKKFSQYTNVYTNSNFYLLGIRAAASVRNVQSVSLPAPGVGVVDKVNGKVFFDEDKINFYQSGQSWFSTPLNGNESRVVSNKLNGWIPGSAVRYEYYVFSRASADATFAFEESGSPLGTSAVISGMSEYDLNSPQTLFALGATGAFSATPQLGDARSNIKITYQTNGSVALGYIHWMRIFYQQQLAAVNDQLNFHSPDSSGIVEYSVTNFSSNTISAYDVTSVNHIRSLPVELQEMAGVIIFRDSLSTGKVKRYWVGTPAAYQYPRSAQKINNSDLRGATGAEFVIITHADLKSEAERLKNHKESLPNPLSTIVVEVDTIYNEFGIGMPDPSAIRNFLYHATTAWDIAPKYVLFFGDASYDYRSILGTDRSLVPTYETPQSNDKINTYNNEDFFTYLDPNNTTKVTIASGRLTARDADDARLMVDRIIAYEKNPVRGTWKNLITIVADDLWSTDSQSEYFNTFDSETLASTYTPDDYVVRKIYTEEYPLVFAASGRRRPDARAAILDQVNNGTLILNYAGHGNPKVWAHESLLSYDDVRTQFSNGEKLTFVVAATCDWGRFDEAGEPSSAEEMMINKAGGAIGVLSATRAVFADRNAVLNQKFYSYVLVGNTSVRLGDAYMLMKNELTDFNQIVNKQKYFLLGDPTLRLAAPEGRMTVDSLLSVNAAVIDTIKALEKVTMRGFVRKPDSSVNAQYNGTAFITVHDAQRSVSIPTMNNYSYSQLGAVMYRGEGTIKNGILSATFIVPKDISYQNKKGRISIYFYNDTSDGRGYTSDFIVGGTNQLAVSDSLGPTISIYFDNTQFRSGDVVAANPTLIVDLSDSSGINSSANSIGHRIEAWIDGSAKGIDLTEHYKGNVDSYQSGTASYRLSDLAPGDHSVAVRAWDVYNNSASAETRFFVSGEEGLSIYNVFNFPNPVSRTTTFTFQHNQLSAVDVTIRIYTVAGRLVHSVDSYGYADRFFKIDWDTRDHDGDLVGNGNYLYRVRARTVDGRYSSEATGSLSVVR